MASLHDVQEFRVKLFSFAAERGNPGLLPCGVNECSTDGSTTYHEPRDIEFAEPSVIRERAGVVIGNARNAKLIPMCRSCAALIRRAGLFHD